MASVKIDKLVAGAIRVLSARGWSVEMTYLFEPGPTRSSRSFRTKEEDGHFMTVYFLDKPSLTNLRLAIDKMEDGWMIVVAEDSIQNAKYIFSTTDKLEFFEDQDLLYDPLESVYGSGSSFLYEMDTGNLPKKGPKLASDDVIARIYGLNPKSISVNTRPQFIPDDFSDKYYRQI